MSSAPQIEPFVGTGTWEECNSFIRGIRAHAWKEGRLRDVAWMADFASLHFSHKALRWHSRLPEDVRQDWSKLETSILDRWAPPEDDEGVNIEPTPAAAPSTTRDRKADLPLRGTLTIAMDGIDPKMYVKLGDGGEICAGTVDAKQAFRIRCNSCSDGTLLERIDNSSPSWLAVQWQSKTPDMGNDSADYARLVLINPDTLKSSWAIDTPCQITRGTVSKNGEVSFAWKTELGGDIALFPFFLGSTLIIVVNPQYWYSSIWKRAKLFVESAE